MMKLVNINNNVVKALFDTGSKYNLLTEDIYRKIPNIVLSQTLVRLVGFGSNDIKNDVKPMGKFQCSIHIDDQLFEINFLVVPNKFMNVQMIIGEEFCIYKEVKIDSNGVHFEQNIKQAVDEEPNVMAIGQVYANEINIDHYKHVFVVVDGFTKFCWIYATKTTSAACAITKLKAQSNIFGNPKQIISDRGAAFMSEEFKEYCKQENIQHFKITTGLPRANGQVERLNAVIATALAKAAIDDPSKWYRYTEIVQQYINSTSSRSTNYSPFELLTGVKMRLKEDPRIKQIIEDEFINRFNDERDQLRQQAKEQIMKTQQENKRKYDTRRKPATMYKIGELVAVKRTQFGGGLKVKRKYLGPYQIVKCKPNNTYDVIRVSAGEGPMRTSSCAEYIKPWPKDYDFDYDDAFGTNDDSG